MKTVLATLIIAFFSLSLCAQETIQVPSQKTVELTYEEFRDFDLKLTNLSTREIGISVLHPDTKKQLKGFGLGSLAHAELSVASGQILRIKNNSTKTVALKLRFIEKLTIDDRAPVASISFTLRNSSLKSIPLIIPNVMNPNLSPVSNSGVNLRIGQKIYYKKGLRKKLLLTVDSNISEGDKIDVAKLIQKLEKDS